MSKQITMEKLNAVYFDYFGYFWCEGILTIGDVSEILDDLPQVTNELKLNLLHYCDRHDLEIIPRFLTIVNPNFLLDIKQLELFKYIFNFFDTDIFLFTKRTDVQFEDSNSRIIIPNEKLSYTFLKKFCLKLLIDKHGKHWLFEEIDDIVI